MAGNRASTAQRRGTPAIRNNTHRMLATIATWVPLTEKMCRVPLLRKSAINSSASGCTSPMTTARMTIAAWLSSAKPAVTALRKPMRTRAPQAASLLVSTWPLLQAERNTAATP